MNLQTVIKWADRQINEGTNENLFFELSTVKSINKTIELLSEKIIWDFNKGELRILILSYYNELLRRNPNKWTEIEAELSAYFQLLNYGDSNNKLEDFLYYLSDDLSLRNSNLTEVLLMPNYLIENLDKYDGYNKLQTLLAEQQLSGFEIKEYI
ncbi:hypothetical protein [Ferruginibacter sp. SUN106]|uniref:hypothetical protein n=1 Tax=Ferruginibacter sp. SUN106 TaxID=2978348 RepID=UPI003D35D34A